MATTEPPAPSPNAGRMRVHWWWRPGWRPGRRLYTWHLTFDGESDLHRLTRLYQARLQVPGFDLVPPAWLHLTMQGIGFTDEVSEQEVRRVARTAAERCERVAPFALTLGPAYVEAEGILLPVSPAQPVRRLRAALREAVARVRGADRVPDPADGFLPHVSLGYSNADGPAAPMVELMASIEPRVATVAVHAAQLIVLERDTHLYHWRTFATTPLLGTPSV